MSSSKIDLVLFGARGDLSRRKLFPALFQLDKADLLTPIRVLQLLLVKSCNPQNLFSRSERL